MLIAVASQSGIDVDQHFGHAEQFLIFDYGGGSPEPLKTVAVEKYCTSDPNHSFHESRFGAITEALDGCKALLTEMIGEMPKQELLKAGITPVIATGPIADALKLAHDSVCSGGCKGARSEGNCPHA
ncbi:Predicted Fe-Mo cluster-binding protein, NifX family [Malonomonas rubra DSM 5091]|uniref:Predicted Fe-Mo cluster-binding protein, NifX family n=1 Tax=Malonomonas rubra DSM 5091 TaxID=1122189 RepID=A0A1M6N3W6_MALRU|nr:NifB/NifX family molybdenum-iron cluster-binding protein [Malonomonas rubra]SHJ90384.1 Predicted Fe-Mo cluster-binding protein, NifX family [Malonomonas rubra DSM 5091]